MQVEGTPWIERAVRAVLAKGLRTGDIDNVGRTAYTYDGVGNLKGC